MVSVVALFLIALVRIGTADDMACESILDSQRDDVSHMQLPQMWQSWQGTVDGCSLEMVTTFFTTRKDWQQNTFVTPVFGKMAHYYQAALKLKMSVTVIYDELPDAILQHANDKFKFLQVKLTDYDHQEGLNDVRFVILDDVVKQHPEWKYIFLTDLFDAEVKMSPCGHVSPGKLYVGSEEVKLSRNGWMRDRFRDMGGKYLKWFEEETSDQWQLLNAGIVGGHRDVFTQFLEAMRVAISDPELEARVRGRAVTVNMGAFNWAIRKSMGLEENNVEGQPGIVTGFPIHSKFKQFENRDDVWVKHKF